MKKTTDKYWICNHCGRYGRDFLRKLTAQHNYICPACRSQNVEETKYESKDRD